MNNLFKIIMVTLALFAFSIIPSKAFIMDVWELRGVDAQEVSEATIAFKEKAMEAIMPSVGGGIESALPDVTGAPVPLPSMP